MRISFDDYLFIVGNPENEICNESLKELVLSIFGRTEFMYFEFYTFSKIWEEKLEKIFSDNKEIKRVRKTFILDKIIFHKNHQNWAKKIPSGYVMEQIDNRFIETHNYDRNFWNPLSKRFGFCLMMNNEVISSCIAVFVGGGYAEISIETHENYRKKGFATLTSAAFIDYCISHDITPNWACWEERAASIALANKIGFKENHENTVIVLRK